MADQNHKIADWREGRRLRALELKEQGWSQRAIAEALGVTEGAVSQWMKRVRLEGVRGLYRRLAPGPTPKLNAEQRAQLPDLLARGAEAHGFRGDVWTRERVALVIRQAFGIEVSLPTVGRLLRECGWSLQKPARRAKQRDEEAIRVWKEERWPEVKKKR
jgi:transposase